MPPVIAAVAAWAAAYAGVIAVVTVVVTAGTAIYGAAQARKAERQARDAARDAMKDRMVTRIATEAPHRYIYGRAKVGADIVAMFTSGDRDQFRHLVCVHAAHECDAIEEVWVNNVRVEGIDEWGDPTTGRFARDPNIEIFEEEHVGPTFTLSHQARNASIWVFSGTGANMHRVAITKISGRTVTIEVSGPVIVSYESPVSRKFSDLMSNIAPEKTPVVRVLRHLGGADDGVDAYLHSVMGGRWPETAVLRGMCYTVVTLDLNHSEFQGGLVPIHAVIRGRKLYDPRDGQTRWSQNPALAVMDYLTSPLCDVPMSDLPLAQFITAANVCDEALPTGGARYTINGTATSDQDQKGVLESMAQCMAGGLVATTWDVYAGKYIAPVAALTQADIVGSMSINPGVSDASVYNGVKGQYIGPENKYVQTDFAPYQNAAYREADGRDLYTNIDFPFTESLQRVTNLARVFTEDQRNGFTIKAEFSLKAWPLKVGQRITYTSSFIGQTNKIYRITDKSYAPNSAVQLTLKEDDASIWDYADAVVLDSTPNTDLPDPWQIDELDSLECTSGESTLLRQADGSTVPRILASWPATMQQGGVQVEVEWRAVSSPTWERTTVSAAETGAYLSPITPGFYYVVRARRVNPYMNTRSNWVTTVYQVEVFTALPTVYKWSSTKPAPPAGSATITWSSGAFGSAPAGWSIPIPPAPVGGGVSLWAATVPVSDIREATTSFDWAQAEVTLRDPNVAYGNVTGKPDVYRIVTSGGANTASLVSPQGLYVNGVHAFGVVRSYMLVAIRRSDHVIAQKQTYDVWGNGATTAGRNAATLASDLNYFANLPGQFIVIVYAGDEPYNLRMTGGLPEALYRNGASRAVFGSPQFQGRAAYALIGISGCGEGNGAEAYQGAVPDDPNSWIDVTVQLYQGQILGVTSNYKPKTLRDYNYIGDMNATAGAPPGTNVGNTPATTIEAAVNQNRAPFSVTMTGFLPTKVANGAVSYGNKQVTINNGVGPYSILWTASGERDDGLQADFYISGDNTGTAVNIRGSARDMLIRGVVNVTVVDQGNGNKVATASNANGITHGTYTPA